MRIALAPMDPHTPLGRLGVLIGEDASHPTSVYLLAQDGADDLLVISSAPGTSLASEGDDESSRWRDLGRLTARRNAVHFVYVNRVGVEDGIGFSCSSFVADPMGETLTPAPALKETLFCSMQARGRPG